MSTSAAVQKIKVRLKAKMPMVKRLHGLHLIDSDGVLRRVVVAIGLDDHKQRVGAVLDVEPNWFPTRDDASFTLFPKPKNEKYPATFDALYKRMKNDHLPKGGLRQTEMWHWERHERNESEDIE